MEKKKGGDMGDAAFDGTPRDFASPHQATQSKWRVLEDAETGYVHVFFDFG